MSDKKFCLRFKRTGAGRRCAKFETKRRPKASSCVKWRKTGKRKTCVKRSNKKH